jgi:hypothetical protein
MSLTINVLGWISLPKLRLLSLLQSPYLCNKGFLRACKRGGEGVLHPLFCSSSMSEVRYRHVRGVSACAGVNVCYEDLAWLDIFILLILMMNYE